MRSASLDTSFLISFSDPARKYHATAVAYYRHFRTEGIPMYISVLAAGEFAVRQPITDLPLAHFRLAPFTLPHALRAAGFRAAMGVAAERKDEHDQRSVVVNDLNVLGQADEEKITFVLTEDERTLARMVTRLRAANLTTIRVILLKNGFAPDRLEEPDQGHFLFEEELE